MQISTREEDYIIDLLVSSVRDSIGNTLGEIFADPEIVKVCLHGPRVALWCSIDSYGFQVFHGAESDIVWLQQDFSIFVVGLFDTYHASKVLDFQKHGLANLLEAFCEFIPDKRYQLADWRIRYVEIFFSLFASSRIAPVRNMYMCFFCHSDPIFRTIAYEVACSSLMSYYFILLHLGAILTNF